MAQSWNINPASGDYINDNGVPEETDSLLVPAYFRLKTKRTQWLYSTDDTFGSDFYLQKKRKSGQDASAIESVGSRALQPLIDDGRASEVTVTATVASRNAVGMETEIIDARGEPEQIVFPSLGV